MRTIPRSHPFPGRLLVASALLLAANACEREVLLDEARSAAPSMVLNSAPSDELPGRVFGMNEQGTISGMTPEGQSYRWTRGGVQEVLPGGSWAPGGINASGDIAASIFTDGTYEGRRAVIWRMDGQVQVLPLPAGWRGTQAVFINDAGMVAGYVTKQDGSEGFFRWSPGAGMEEVDVGSPESYGSVDEYYEYLSDMNAAGDVLAGYSMFCVDEGPGDECFAESLAGGVVWEASGSIRWLFEDRYGEVTDLTDSGVSVGCRNGPVLWSAQGVEQAIGPFGSVGCATAVNEAGMVAGYTYHPFGYTSVARAFLWTPLRGVMELGTLGGAASRASDVNEAGDVTGWAQTASGGRRGFMWRRGAGMQGLSPLPGTTWSQGSVLNEAGEVAGLSGTEDPSWLRGLRATRWDAPAVARAPVAHAGGPYSTRISGRRYTYDASASSDVDGPSLRYSWDMNADGVFDAVTNYPQIGYAYAAAGTYNLLLEVRDGLGLRDTATTTVRVVQNAAPVISTLTGMPTSRGEGLPITLTPTVTDANHWVDSMELSLVRYRWDWGDGRTSAARVGTHSYADQGTYTVRLIVTDAGGLADTVVRTAVIGNLPPTGRLIAPTSIGEGATFTLSATALTDAPADLAAGFTVAFNCGGGFGAYGTATSIVCPARADQGSVTVRMRVKDKDGAASEATKTIPVGNVAPRVTASVTSPTTFGAGGSFSVSATFTDVAADAPWRYRIYWGDGASTPLTAVAGGATITGSHTYAAPGTYTVQVAVADKDGGSGHSAPIAVTVTP